jgi:hypothetical protein
MNIDTQFGILPGMTETEAHVTRVLHATKWKDEHPDKILRRDYALYPHMYTKEVCVVIGWDAWPQSWINALEDLELKRTR